MTATIENRRRSVRQMKAGSALQGRTIREVTERLYRDWLAVGGRIPNGTGKLGLVDVDPDHALMDSVDCDDIQQGGQAFARRATLDTSMGFCKVFIDQIV